MQATAPGGAGRPESWCDDPQQLETVLRRRILPLVSKPARYLGGELGAVRAPWREDRANLLLAFPDAYEVGISNNGLRILYAGLNAAPDTYADIVFAPWPDMEDRMRANCVPLFSLEARKPARSFDVFGFSLGYELCYTNVLNMIDLAGLPLRAADRGDGDPVVVAGGHCTANPTVLGSYVDLFCLGDGEDAVVDIAEAVRAWKREGGTRAELLERLRRLPGTWWEGKPGRTEARVVTDLNDYPPPAILVPTIEAVHDRLALEVMRGCVRGCRFCQAGMITRPVRERDVAKVVSAAVDGARALGWNEISLLSLSTCDYSGLGEAMAAILARTKGTRTQLELPSLRVDALDESIYDLIRREKPASFTFAPEAGSQRLRDVVNKNVTERDVLDSVGRARDAGAKRIKLYFMIGLPTETDGDLDAIVDLVGKAVAVVQHGGAQITVSISPFSPKAHTPFQWAGQIGRDEMARRNRRLRDGLRHLKVKLSLRDPEVSRLEGVLGLGDGRLGAVVERAWAAGARFDGWEERFDAALWDEAFAAEGIVPDTYLVPRDSAEPLPWDGIFARIDREFLRRDWAAAQRGETVPDCRLGGECVQCEACDGELQHVFSDQGTAIPDSGSAAGAAREARPASPDDGPAFDPRNADPADPARERDRWRKWRDRSPGKCWYRVVYAKTGDAAFWGHLDFQRQIRLAMRRAGLPAAYSQGFNPQPLIKFGPPLPVGVAGEEEMMDLAFTQYAPAWEEALNRQLPKGVRVLASAEVGPVLPGAIDKDVDRYDYRAVLPPPDEGGPEPEASRRAIATFLAAATWPYLRHRPKGDIEVDVRPLVCGDRLTVETTACPETGGTVLDFSLQRPPGEAGLPVYDFLAAVCGDLLPEPRLARVRRTALLARRKDGGWVSPLVRIRELNQRYWLRKHLSA